MKKLFKSRAKARRYVAARSTKLLRVVDMKDAKAEGGHRWLVTYK
jgi:hypothetical protein